MVSSFPFSLMIATVLGFLAGIGVGGGSLLVLWLTLVLGWDQETARGLNLLFFIPAALISTFFRRKQGSLNFRNILPAVISGCIAVFFGNSLGDLLHTEVLKKLFGILLLFAGIREISYKEKK